jgi:general secretion pathway protein H
MRRGFTLIELMVVMAVIAIMAVMAAPALATFTGANARKAAGQLAGSMRAMFDVAALGHKTCRMAIDLDKRTFGAECAPGPAGVKPGAERDEEEKFPEEADPEIRHMLERSKFGKYKDRLIQDTELPGQTKFGAVRVAGRRDAAESGTVYVYFFPGGQMQKAWIPVVDGTNIFTIVTEPFTGRAKVIPGKVEVRD